MFKPIRTIAVPVLSILLSGGGALGQSPADLRAIISPPDSFFALVRERDRDAARTFYKKYLDVGGIPVVAAAEVADLALERTRDIVGHLLAGRPDVAQSMASSGMYLIMPAARMPLQRRRIIRFSRGRR